jgi:hypothetical protein
MKNVFTFSLLLVLSGVQFLHAQVPRKNPITITNETSPTVSHHVKTTSKIDGSPLDTAIFDSTHRVPFKIHEWRGEEMIHNWISLGAPRAPHLYLGAGIYRFDKFGMSDIQLGAYPIVYPDIWECYFSASQMIFLKKKSKMVDVGVCIDEGYAIDGVNHYEYVPKLRRDKFYGITAGITYEGVPNVKNKTLYLSQYTDANGENFNVVLEKFRQVNVSVGLSRMKCRNVEYEAPFRRKGRFHASSMSRFTIGGSYYPINDVRVLADTNFVVDYLIRATQPDFSAFISWEGRTAFLHMKRECGFHMNFIFTCPTWNRVNDLPMSLVWTWGLYFSLDKKNPDWRKKLDSASAL